MDGKGATVIPGFIVGKRRAVDRHFVIGQIVILADEHGAAPAAGFVTVKQGRGDVCIGVRRVDGAAQRTGYVAFEHRTFSNGHLGKVSSIGVQIDGTARSPGSLAGIGVIPIVFEGDVLTDVQFGRSPSGDGAAGAAVIAVCALGDRLVQIVLSELNIVFDGDRTAVAVDGTATIILASRIVVLKDSSIADGNTTIVVVNGTALMRRVASEAPANGHSTRIVNGTTGSSRVVGEDTVSNGHDAAAIFIFTPVIWSTVIENSSALVGSFIF